MNVTIDIHYKSDRNSKITQSGAFPLKGNKPEQVALEFWKQIKDQMSYRIEIEEIILNGETNITDIVKELENKEWRKIESNFDLPF